MPLPALDLDTRTWDDLVEEARALVPRLAPGWTDHNAHDPGITLVELLAYLTEQSIYRLNRVPERHRRKFLRLAGFLPAPPRAAAGVAAFALRPGAAPVTLPAGLTVGTPGLRLRTSDPLTVTGARIAAVQSFDGRRYTDSTRPWRDRLPVPALGADPGAAADQPALLIGFDRALTAGEELSLWLGFAGRVARDQVAGAHHSLRTVWEVHDGGAWVALDPAQQEVADATRALSLDGAVRLQPPVATGASVQGADGDPHHYVRCRVTAGAPDAPPVLLALAADAVEVSQRAAARQTFALAPGPPLPAALVPGARGRLALTLDADGAVTALAFGAGAAGPDALVLEHVLRSTTRPGSLTVTVVLAGRGAAEPGQCLELPDGLVADGEVEVWAGERWEPRDDLDAAGPGESVFRLEPAASLLCVGDGERGRVIADGTPVLASYDVTLGRAGGAQPAAVWGIAGVDDAWNAALTGAVPQALDAAVAVAPLVAPGGGADAETVAHAAGRAAAAVWAHERLLELCPSGAPQTLDQVPRADVLERVAPERASTLLDFERLALAVPGVDVRRARAIAGVDPRDPCLRAPATVTVVVLAGRPASYPEPEPGLLEAVHRHLDRRRVIGTRLRVVGPSYVDIRVRARVRARSGAGAALAGEVAAALDAFLDPLVGGPQRTGWPFGRDVYRSEVLELVASVAGVEHVLELELEGPSGGGCDNVCVPPAALVRAGAHEIEEEAA
jgi:predicted phage baseplate assembly protein